MDKFQWSAGEGQVLFRQPKPFFVHFGAIKMDIGIGIHLNVSGERTCRNVRSGETYRLGDRKEPLRKQRGPSKRDIPTGPTDRIINRMIKKAQDASLYSDPQPIAGRRDPAEDRPSAVAHAIGHIDDRAGVPSARTYH